MYQSIRIKLVKCFIQLLLCSFDLIICETCVQVNEMAQDLTNLTDTSNITEGFDVPFYRHSMAITICVCLACKSRTEINSIHSLLSNDLSLIADLDTFVFVLGLVGNCLVVAVICRAPRMRTVTNSFIVSKISYCLNQIKCFKSHH